VEILPPAFEQGLGAIGQHRLPGLELGEVADDLHEGLDQDQGTELLQTKGAGGKRGVGEGAGAVGDLAAEQDTDVSQDAAQRRVDRDEGGKPSPQ
jgi:hypothetical protein